MKRKFKVTLLVLLFVTSSILLMVPQKADAIIVVTFTGKTDVVNGLVVCICPTKDHTCECDIWFPTPY